jgi:hypothetical protein
MLKMPDEFYKSLIGKTIRINNKNALAYESNIIGEDVFYYTKDCWFEVMEFIYEDYLTLYLFPLGEDLEGRNCSFQNVYLEVYDCQTSTHLVEPSEVEIMRGKNETK